MDVWTLVLTLMYDAALLEYLLEESVCYVRVKRLPMPDTKR